MIQSRRSFYLASTASLLLISLAGYGRGAPAAQAGKGVRKLRLSLFRSGSLEMGISDPATILQASRPLVSYIEKETGAQVEVTVPKNYQVVTEAMSKNEIDIAYLGGFDYAEISARVGARPLVQRPQDRNWRCVFITQPQLKIHSLQDLSGHSFAFGDVNSTSGHLIPEYYMRAAKVDPKVIERALYTGRHDATALAVASKKVDAGAMADWMLDEMKKDGRINAQQVRVFFAPPPFPDPVWTARKDFDAQLAERFARAFLKLDAKNPEQKAVLDFLKAEKYVRAKDSDYETLRQALRIDGLLK
jgi:phosphonate transport system substrate-binding protein